MLLDCFRRVGVVHPRKLELLMNESPDFWDRWDDEFDWGEGSDVPIVSSCDLESSEECDSCQ
jgi:hypothetical protein